MRIAGQTPAAITFRANDSADTRLQKLEVLRQAVAAATAAVLANGDYGDIVVSGGGTVFTIDPGILTTFGRSLIVTANAGAARTVLGLGTAATADSSTFQPVDADLTAIAALATTTFGRSFLTLADATAGRTLLGLGTSAVLASDTDTTLAANSDLRVATQKAVKAYVDANVAGLLDYKGGIACAANPNYPAALKGDAYNVTTAGLIGGASGLAVDIGDVIVATADNAGGTQAAVGASWIILEHNLTGALAASNNLSDLASASTARGNLGLVAIASSGSASDLTAGTVPAARMPALTGDITTAAGAVATTLATVNANVGSFGDATHVPAITVDGKGRITAASSVAITGSYPWTEKVLTSDFTNATTSANLITDGTNALSFTPPANSNWEAEALLLVESAAITTGPRVGVSVAAQGTGSYGSCLIETTGATAATFSANFAGWTTAAGGTASTIGDWPTANTPFLVRVTMRGHSGASPALIQLTLASETASTTVTCMKGSLLRTKSS